jgi:hypothetical protein
MTMKSRGLTLLELALICSGGVAHTTSVRKINVDTNREEPKKIIPKGHKRFMIDGIEIYALNLKNAQKKINKIRGIE